MTLYECPRCHHVAQSKRHYSKHLNRKRPCLALYCDEPPGMLLEALQQEYKEKPFACDRCECRFAHAAGLSRHKSTHKKTDEVVNNVVHAVHNNCHSADNSYNTTTNSNNVNNSHNAVTIENLTQNIHIHINPMGTEDLWHIENDQAFLTKCLQNILADGIPNLVEKIYMDPEMPQNHNVKLQREKPPGTMMVYIKQGEGDMKWVPRDLNTTLDTMIEKGSNILIMHNNSVYRITKDHETFDHRSNNISHVRAKKRGVYGKIRQGVLCKVKEKRDSDAQCE